MTDQVTAFADKIRSDGDLRSKLVALQGCSEAELPQKIADLAKNNGFSISADDVKQFISKQSQPVELTDAALQGPVVLGATYSWPGC